MPPGRPASVFVNTTTTLAQSQQARGLAADGLIPKIQFWMGERGAAGCRRQTRPDRLWAVGDSVIGRVDGWMGERVESSIRGHHRRRLSRAGQLERLDPP